VSAVTPTESIGRTGGRIGIAILVGSALGYLVVVGTGRLLDNADYAIFMTFWGALFGLGSALGPIEQELSRLSAHAAVTGRPVGRDAVTTTVVGAVAVAAVGLALVTPAATDRLFGGNAVLGVVVAVCGVAFAAQFAVRGLLIGTDQIRPYAKLIVAEAAVRPLLIAVVVVLGMSGMVSLAIAVGVGSFAWILFVRSAVGRVDRSLPGDPVRVVTPRVLLLLAGAALTASVITGYPAMVGLLAPGGDRDALAGLYAALAVARIPLLMFAPVQALAVPMVVRLASAAEGVRRLRRILAVGTVGSVALAALGALVGALIGPWVVSLLFGARYEVGGASVAGLVWSSVILVAVQLLTAALVALVRPGQVLLTWLAVAVTAAGVLVVDFADPVERAVWGLAIAPTVGLVVAVVFVARAAGRHRESVGN